MLDRSDNSQDDEGAIEACKMTSDERKLLTLYREMSDLDQRYIFRVAEVLAAASI
jgi:hypothetical protein